VPRILAITAGFGIALLGGWNGSGAAPAAPIASQSLPDTTAARVDDAPLLPTVAKRTAKSSFASQFMALTDQNCSFWRATARSASTRSKKMDRAFTSC
jgi:hypothetical protein